MKWFSTISDSVQFIYSFIQSNVWSFVNTGDYQNADRSEGQQSGAISSTVETLNEDQGD